ncbi:alkaline phosphatase [Alicyclobacillus contaminans]|uniref:DedA family protein n=1 Tax=Alicyclobacillus contaminans TaxID=392016 RepID=UPI0003F916F4|nr:DedA family protein [Alicyclobacillus contaminans]GMA50385.1 alkaline phosphatase [Alicyclobacillus contaminans]
MLDWFGWAADGVLDFGYVGVFITLVLEGLGFPFPGDGLLTFYGFASARGQLQLPGVALCSIAGYLCGSTLAYLISRHYGVRLLNAAASRWLFNARQMSRTTSLIDRYGPWLLIPGRFLPGVRSASPYVAGFARMALRPFLLYTGIGAALWCIAWIGLGYWAGDHMEAVLRVVQSSLAYVTGGLLVTVLLIVLYRTRRAR